MTTPQTRDIITAVVKTTAGNQRNKAVSDGSKFEANVSFYCKYSLNLRLIYKIPQICRLIHLLPAVFVPKNEIIRFKTSKKRSETNRHRTGVSLCWKKKVRSESPPVALSQAL